MVTVAVVGAGGMGRTHLNNLKDMEQLRVAAICDPNPAVAELAETFQAKYYTELDRMARIQQEPLVREQHLRNSIECE